MKRLLWILLGVAAILSATRGVSNALGDSGDFHWDVARLLLDGSNPYRMFLNGQRAYTDAIVHDLFQPNQLPSALVPVFPYALLSWNSARLAWFLTNVVATLVLLLTFFRWRPELVSSRFAPLGVTLLLLAGTPWRHSLGKGQHSLVAFAAFVVAVYALERRRPLLSGVALAVSFLKYSITFPLLPYFLYKRDLRPPLLAFAIHTVVHLLMAQWIHSAPLALLLDPLRIAATVTLGRGYLDVFTIARLYGWSEGGAVVAAGVLVASVVVITWRNPSRSRSPRDVWVLAYLCLVSNVVIYHSWYDFVTLLPLVALAWSPGVMPRPVRGVLAGAIGMLWFFNRLLVEIVPRLPDTRLWSQGFYTVSVLYYALTLVVVGKMALDAAHDDTSLQPNVYNYSEANA